MTGYSEAASLYWERGFLPIPVKGKRPVPAGATGRGGSVTAEKVSDWAANGFQYQADGEWRVEPASTANTALRAGPLEVRIDVDAYGDKDGAAQLAELEARLGTLPATPTSTSRGADSPARQHFFLLREPIELVGKAAKDIDVIQSRHRYSLVWPSTNPDADNAPYLWYDADGAPMSGPPSMDDLEYLPEAWVEFLRADEREYGHQAKQWDGDIPAVATATEERKLRTIVARLQSLPEVWAPGAGWHDTVRDAACWLSRIARSNAYTIDADHALQLLLDHTPTYPSWGVDKIIEQWESAQRTTAGQFEDPPTDSFPKMLVMQRFPMDRPYPDVSGRPFVAAWAHAPYERAAHRAALLGHLLDAGVDQLEAVTLIWHCAANRFLITFGDQTIDDPHTKITTLEEFWAEINAVLAHRAEPADPTAEPAPAAEIELPPAIDVPRGPQRPAFLTDTEREVANGVEWFGSRFLEWAVETFAYVNMPYFRMNLWTVLSIVFGPKGALPKSGGLDRPLNLFIAIVGLTTSGKSEALRVIKKILKAYYVVGESPDVGGDFSNESLTKTLIERDGKSTWFHMDEAHTKIPSWRKPGPYSQVPGILTEVYDGEVGAIHRNTDKDISGKDARAYLTVHLMGTPQGMADVMGPVDWESGFLNRFIWAIGELPSTSIDALAGGFVSEEDVDDDSEAILSGEKWYQQWAAEFANAVQRVSGPDETKPVRVRLPQVVIERHKRFVGSLFAIADRGAYAERLRPTFRRLGETTMRAAALVALSQGRTRLELTDLLIAISFAEEWAGNILIMVEATDESIRTREVNQIEAYLLQRGGAVTLAEVHRIPRFKNRRREVEDMIQELSAQGRAQLDANKILHATGMAHAA